MSILLIGMGTERRAMLAEVMKQWDEFAKNLPRQRNDVYSFAYWLIRYSGWSVNQNGQ